MVVEVGVVKAVTVGEHSGPPTDNTLADMVVTMAATVPMVAMDTHHPMAHLEAGLTDHLDMSKEVHYRILNFMIMTIIISSIFC